MKVIKSKFNQLPLNEWVLQSGQNLRKTSATQQKNKQTASNNKCNLCYVGKKKKGEKSFMCMIEFFKKQQSKNAHWGIKELNKLYFCLTAG